MPIAALLPALITAGGSIGGSLLGGAAGATNLRPPALNPAQSSALNTLLPQLMGQVQGQPHIDPVQQVLMYNQIGQNLTGANNQVTNALTSRGLGQSGLLGAGLIQNSLGAQSARNSADLGLQNQAIQQRQANIGDILGLLNINSTPGQSGAGGFLAGMAGPLSYSIQNMLNQRSGFNPNSGPYGMNGNGNLPITTANPGASLQNYGAIVS